MVVSNLHQALPGRVLIMVSVVEDNAHFPCEKSESLHPVRAPEDGSAAWLATAGSGDVLAGFCTGLLARGMDPVAAGRIGALLHLECGRSIGPGLIAEDIPEALPRVFRRIGCGVAQPELPPLGPAC